MTFISVGYGNIVAADRIISVAAPDSAPIKRLVFDAKEAGRAIDLCCGRKCRSVIVCDTDHVITTSLTLERLSARLMGDVDSAENDDEG